MGWLQGRGYATYRREACQQLMAWGSVRYSASTRAISRDLAPAAHSISKPVYVGAASWVLARDEGLRWR